VCIGMSFAMQEAVIVLAHLIRALRFDLAPGHVVAPIQRVTLRPRYGMKMIVRRRALEPRRHGENFSAKTV